MLARRRFLIGAGSLFSAPAIVSSINLMPVKVIPKIITPYSPLGVRLATITRTALIPRLYVQIYQSHPLMREFIANREIG